MGLRGNLSDLNALKEEPLTFELAGKTLGLVGFGRIGQAVATRAHAFDALIIYQVPHLKERLAAATWGAKEVSFADLLRQSVFANLQRFARGEPIQDRVVYGRSGGNRRLRRVRRSRHM